MIINNEFNTMLSSPVRQLRGRVEIYKGSTLALMCSCHDRLKSFTVERTGAKNKFFGYGICQKLTARLLDKNRELDITADNTLEVEYGVGSSYIYPLPNFYVTEVNRDEKTNELSITAYDALYRAASHTVAELELTSNYTIADFAAACAAILGIPLNNAHLKDNNFLVLYPTGANFDGTETIRQVLDAIAEVTQTVYYINGNWELTFKKLDIDGAPVITISKDKYIDLDSKSDRQLATITHATELGDNISATTGEVGAEQFIRDNPFLELREDISAFLDNAIANVGGLTINQFACNWRGNYLVELGDKIALITKDNAEVISYLLDDTTAFDGSLNQKSSWSYENNESETASNPTNLGDALKQTYARVDKANKQIELVASDVSTTKDQVSSLVFNTDGIIASVEEIDRATKDSIEGINSELNKINSKVEAQITAEDVRLEIKQEIDSGLDKVKITGKEFILDDKGLTIEDLSETNNKIKTTISNNGMTVYSNNNEVLIANDEGVKAKDLHATTFLIIGNNSRLEDYGSSRTGCFWIGG
jgi:hypothetical protein